MSVQPGDLPVGYQNTPVVDVETGESQYDNAGNRLYTRTNYQVPAEGIAGSGLAALAAKTEEDWVGQFADSLLDTIDPLNALFLNIATTVMEFFSNLVDLPGMLAALDNVLQFVYNLLDSSGLLDFLAWLWNRFGEVAESFLKPVMEFLAWLWDKFGDVVEAVLKPIFDFLEYLWNQLSPYIEPFINPFMNFVAWVLDTFGDVIKTVLTGFFNLMMFIANLIDFSFLQDLLQPVFDFFKSLGVGPAAFLELVKNAFAAFANLTSGGIPFIQGVINSVAAALGQSADNLLSWARGLLPRGDLLGLLQGLFGQFLALFPVANINNTKVNLLNTGEFRFSSTVEAAAGWSWDSSRNKTGSVGGSAKVTANGTNRILYSNQNISVASGDQIAATAYVYTQSFTANVAAPIRLLLIPFAGATQQTSVVLAQRGVSNNEWGLIGNESSPWKVPAGVTSVQLGLQVTSGGTGGTVNWDDVWLFKAGLMQQGLVAQLVGALSGFIGGLLGLPTPPALSDDGASQTDSYNAGKSLADTADATDLNLQDTNSTLFGDPDGGTIDDLAGVLGVSLTSGSGARMSRTDTTNLVTAQNGNRKFSNFYSVNSASADITASASASSFTVTYAGYYLVEVAYTTNADTGLAGAFNVAPAVYIGNSDTPFKVGADSFGSYGFGLGGFARSAQSSFIVYLPAGGSVTAGYVNRLGTKESFFVGDANGANCYYSIAMLNRTEEG